MDKPKITQAMIDAYDEYTHLSLDRRKFMEKLTVLAGSGAAAAAIAPLLSANSARAAIVAPDDAGIVAEEVTYPGPAGEMKGYLVTPKSASGPIGSVIVIHENRGLNDHIRDVARRVALAGFRALAVDFLSPQGGTPADEEKARQMFSGLDMMRPSPMPKRAGCGCRLGRGRMARSVQSVSAGAAGWSIVSRLSRQV